MSLATLPPDLVLMVADCLDSFHKISPLARSCHRLYSILNRYLYRQNVRYDDGSALVWAVCCGEAGTAKHVLIAGADVNQEYPRGLPQSNSRKVWGPPLYEAVVNRGEVLKGRDRSVGEYQSIPLPRQNSAKHDALIRLLVEWGADIEGTSSERVMKAAVETDDATLVQLLISSGAHHGAKATGFSPLLQIAAKQGNTDIIRLLLDEGFANNATAANGSTPLHAAASAGKEAAVRLLIQEGYDVKTQTCYRRSPLHELISGVGASPQAENAIRLLLIEHGADAFARDVNGYTLLHAAVLANRRIVPQLVQLGLDVNARNNAGHTPLHLLRRPPNPEMVNLLHQCGAKVHLKDKSGRAALDDVTLLRGLVSMMHHRMPAK